MKETKKEEPTVILNKILELESIEKVYYVDEEIGDPDYSLNQLFGLIEQAEQKSKFSEVQKIKGRDYSLDHDYQIIKNEITSFWGSLNEVDQKNIIERVAEIGDPEWLVNIKMPATLNTLFAPNIINSLMPKEWDENMVEIVTNLPAGRKILVLFDEETKYKKKGRNFILDVKTRKYLDRVIPILFTNKILDLATEMNERDQIISELSSRLEPSDFLALAKKRGRKPKEFVDGIKKAILNTYCEKLKDVTINILEKAFEVSIDRLRKIDTYDFDNVVLKSSYQEGIWEALTFYRVADILYQEGIFEEMIQQEYLSKFNNIVKKSKLISDIQTDSAQNIDPQYNRRLTLRQKELYQDSKMINTLYLPLDSGDIFKVNSNAKEKENFYILIGQECDLMLRVDNKSERNKKVIPGTRRAKLGVLLPIKIHETDLTAKEQTYILRYFNTDALYTGEVEFNNPIYVDLDLLEVTAFSGNGEARLNLNRKEVASQSLSFSMMERYKLMRENLSKKMESFMILSRLRKRHSNKIGRNILKGQLPAFSFPDNSHVKISFTKGIIEMNIERVGRLKGPFAKQLLEKFTRYQSRHADPHDFAK